ncbi:MAG: hypothetical protein JJT94_11490 [Bernardetiaceae bacterium]|nr:hypothetical protein [Bernardetiaceae bacterium]
MKSFKTLNLIFVFLILFLAACQSDKKKKTEETDTPTEEVNASNEAENATPSAPDYLGYGVDLPDAKLNAEAGDYVLCPTEAALRKYDTTKSGTILYYVQELKEVGDKTSLVKFSMSEARVANNILVPIPKGQEAKKGDIVLTWWQTGSGLERGLVVDDSNPKEPIVRYLGLEWGNPAKYKDKLVAQQDYQLKPNSFQVIKDDFVAGRNVLIDGNTAATVLALHGDKVLILGYASRMSVVDKSQCMLLPLSSAKYKAGDEVNIITRMNGVAKAKVISNEPTLGRVKVDVAGKEEMIAYGKVFDIN